MNPCWFMRRPCCGHKLRACTEAAGFVQVSGSSALAAMHPSWVAKKQQASLPQAQGKKIVFDD